MDYDRNSCQYWQAGSYLTDTGGDEEVLQSLTTPYHSVPVEGVSCLLPDDPDASWLPSDLEDHESNAFSSGPFDLIENAIPSRNWEFSSQFRVDAHASPESRENFEFSVAGDGDVESLGLCSRATQGQLPHRNQISARSIAPNLKSRRNQNKIDGVKDSKTGRRHRGPNWTLEENRSFLQHMEVQTGKSPWKAISDSLKAMGFVREAQACEDHWGVLLADLKKFQIHFGSDDILRDLHFWPSVGTMSRAQRSQNRLPLVFEEKWFEVIARIVKERSCKHRKSRREYSKGRIHVAGTPASSSRRHQSRVSATSATPSSEIFDNLVGDGDGISGLVKLLDSTERNVTFDQIIEVGRITLEAKKVDLRRKEIEWKIARMDQDQRNELTENARRPPAAQERN